MARTLTASSTEALAGLVDRVTFHNSDNGFCVLRVKARGQRDLITVIGHAAMISAGEFVQASGSWINDRTHGVQFRASFLKATAPTTVEGIEKYLGSGMIRGIGPVYARKLVRAFGEAVFDVIEQEPGRLRDVTGIGPKRAERIIAGWAEQKVIREIMLFLHSNGVGTSRARLAEMRRGPAIVREQGNVWFLPSLEAALAEAEARAGETDAGLRRLDDALAELERTEQRWYEAELYRIRGETLLKRDPANTAAAEQSLQTAIAQSQKARSFELRAALSLVKLYRAANRDVDAHAVLAPAVEGFPPTQQFPELAEAQTLLAALSR
jgi:hypothetical protein